MTGWAVFRWLGPALLAAALVVMPAAAETPTHARIDSLNALGRGFLFDNIERSSSLYGEVAVEARALGYREGEARALQIQGIALYLGGHFEEGVEASLRAIRLFEELDLRRELAMTYGDLGYQMKRRNMPRAKEFMLRGIAIAEAGADSFALCTLYDNFGVLHEISAGLDSAGIYYQRGLDFKTALDDSFGIPFSLAHLSGLAALEGRMDEAEDLLRLSDNYRTANRDTFGLIQNSVQWAEMEYMNGYLAQAAVRYERTLRIPAIYEHDRTASYCFERLASIYEELGDFEKAFGNQQRFTAYRDSLYDAETTSRMAELELEYDTERKDRLLAENRLEAAARSRQILILTGIAVVLLVAGLGAVRYQQLKGRKLQEEMELRARLRRSEYEQRMADEKLRISRELHDNIGAQLTFMTSTIDNISRQTEEGPGRSGLDSLADFGRNTIGELRQTVWAMKAEGEGFDALVQKLQELKRQCGAAGRTLEFTVKRPDDRDIPLSSSHLLNTYRIAQEAVQNAVKHTTDGPITVNLEARPEEIVLVVCDEGPGFDRKAIGHVGGLANMKQRCREMAGELEITSGTKGTSIVYRFPAE